MKAKAILLSIWYGLVIAFKRVPAWIFYPIAYLAKEWVYGNDMIKNYTMPKGVQESWLKGFFWWKPLPKRLEIYSQPLTVYYGWNTDANGRFTVAFKFK